MGSNSEVLTPFRWPESNIVLCANGLHGMNLAQSETLRTWRRSLHGPGRPHPCPAWNSGPAHEGNRRTVGMNADEESDEGNSTYEATETKRICLGGGRGGRTSPKGNGGESAAVRTPSRDTASIGLVAVRQAARPK